MTFPRNPIDNSLDMVAFEKLSQEDKKLALISLRTESQDDFQKVMDYLRKQKEETIKENEKEQAQMHQQAEALDKKYNDLEKEKNTYFAAYKSEMLDQTFNETRSAQNNKTRRAGCTIL